MFIIYHNPKCSKSRETLKLLEEHTNDIKIIEYLKETPTQSELAEIATKLKLNPLDFIRTTESIIKEESIDLSDNDHALMAMEKFPKIIERPIVVKGDRAIIGRPPEKVKELF